MVDKYFFEMKFASEEKVSFEYDKEILSDILNCVNSGKVLDLGCGLGGLSLALAERGFDVTCVDISQTAIDRIAKESISREVKIKTVLADLETYEIKGKYDVVIITGVLHFLGDYARDFLKKARNHTNDGGINVLDAFRNEFLPSGVIEEIYAGWELLEGEEYTFEKSSMIYLVFRKPPESFFRDKDDVVLDCKKLLDAYREGKLGYMKMPEDSNPGFSAEEVESRLVYFTLPMSLNYQRDSYKLWESALKSFEDSETREVFDVKNSSGLTEEELREKLLKHKVALQPNKHISTWQKISKTIFDNWGSISNLLSSVDYDFLKLRETVQGKFKKGFPYLSGPKIFNYWSFIIQEYGGIKLKNSEFIDIAPDTHVTKCSVNLGVISPEESESLTKEQISERWRKILEGTGITPIEMHPPLWFWSRNNFQFKLF